MYVAGPVAIFQREAIAVNVNTIPDFNGVNRHLPEFSMSRRNRRRSLISGLCPISTDVVVSIKKNGIHLVTDLHIHNFIYHLSLYILPFDLLWFTSYTKHFTYKYHIYLFSKCIHEYENNSLTY